MSLALQDFPSLNDTDPPKPLCRQCTATLDADDNYCRRCGTPTAWGVKLGVAVDGRRPVAWESPWVVLPLLFFVLGPLALPLLWRSRRFTLLWKWVLTVIITALTVFFVLTTWIALERTLAPLQKALDVSGF
jgi:ribosomal protein L40E